MPLLQFETQHNYILETMFLLFRCYWKNAKFIVKAMYTDYTRQFFLHVAMQQSLKQSIVSCSGHVTRYNWLCNVAKKRIVQLPLQLTSQFFVE